MAVSQRLDLRQTQSLVMTPQLQQAIKLLQLSNLELAAYLEQELERNPLLDRDDDGGESDAAGGGDDDGDAAGDRATPDDRSARDSAELTAGETLPAEHDAPLDIDYENVYDTDSVDTWGRLSGGATGADGEDGQSFDQRTADKLTLRQHLGEQLQVEARDPIDRTIGLHLIDMLDPCGYVRGDLDELSALLGCPLARVEETLRLVQKFDPPGIFARSLSECLAIQLADRDRLDPAMQALLDHLPLMARRDLAGLREACGVDDEDLMDMIAEIRALDPKPAEAFEAVLSEPVIPDILMRPTPDGSDWIIELNSETLPRVLVNTHYHARVAARARSKAEKDYLSQQYQSANWLVRSLHQRATTILKVSTQIVRQQDAFFRKGIQELRPLTLRSIAEAIEMHESTVSRVTTNKYIATPRGLYELKYFFTAALGGMDGEASHSATAVRHRIKTMIDSESPKKILSDDAIVGRLRAEGIDIARRTVAKYREAMRIPSSVQRRREKAIDM